MLKFRKYAGKWVAFGSPDEMSVGEVKVWSAKEQGLVPFYVGEVVVEDGNAYGLRGTPPAKVVEHKAFTPTPEQAAVVEAFLSGRSCKVEAFAGTGKTTVLRAGAVAAYEQKGWQGRYIAFNKSIVEEAAAKMPACVSVSTAHSLALGLTPPAFRERLKGSGKLDAKALHGIAKRLRIDPIELKVDGEIKPIRPGKLAGMAMRTIGVFCKSDDREIRGIHVPPMDNIDADGMRRNNDILRDYILPFAQKAWVDLCDPQGVLPYGHAHYLKQFALTDPVLPIDYLMVDEAQDLSPVLLSIVRCQRDAGIQVILVGDSFQAINGFTGAVNAMAHMETDITLYLTKSWRFGNEIASYANEVLSTLGAPKPIQGNDAIQDYVGPLDAPAAFLSRSNAGAVREMFNEISRGGRPKLVGAVDEIRSYCSAALKLQRDESTDHADLSWADSWAEVVAFSETEDGADHRLMVEMIQKNGAQAILDALRDSPKDERDATLVVSTAHKVKGREWKSVKLDGGLGRYRLGQPPTEDELMLLYVAVTRGQRAVDLTAVDFFRF